MNNHTVVDVWIDAPAPKASSASPVRLVVAILAALFVAVTALILLWSHPYIFPRSYLASVEKAGKPTVEAINAYIARNGFPPDSLADLLPQYDARLTGTGYPRQSEFFYRSWRVGGKRADNPWMLILFTDWLALDSDEINYDSTTGAWTSHESGTTHRKAR